MKDEGVMRREDLRSAADSAAQLLRTLSNRTRLMILCELSGRECTVGELERKLDLGQAYVSQQLAHLRDQRLVSATREGRMRRYRLEESRAGPILAAIMEIYCKPAA